MGAQPLVHIRPLGSALAPPLAIPPANDCVAVSLPTTPGQRERQTAKTRPNPAESVRSAHTAREAQSGQKYSEAAAVLRDAPEAPQRQQTGPQSRRLVSRLSPGAAFSLRNAPVAWLEVVDLENCGLVDIPEELFFLVRVGELRLRHNKITAVPEKVQNLGELRVLDASHNAISHVSPAIGRLERLEVLDLSWNRLAAFPFGVAGRMAALANLALEANYLDPSTADAAAQDRLREIAPSAWQQLVPQQILPFLFLGGVAATACPHLLRKMGINNVLSVGVHPASTAPDFNYQFYPFHDEPSENLSPAFVPSARFIDRAVTSRSGVLVHCRGGVSRSVTLVCAYLMLYKGMTLDKALELVRSVRVIADPNPGFMQLLRAFNAALDSY